MTSSLSPEPPPWIRLRHRSISARSLVTPPDAGARPRRRRRAGNTARGARSRLRALLSRCDRATGGTRVGARARDRRRARRALGRQRPPPRRPRDADRGRLQTAAYRTLTIVLPMREKATARLNACDA